MKYRSNMICNTFFRLAKGILEQQNKAVYDICFNVGLNIIFGFQKKKVSKHLGYGRDDWISCSLNGFYCLSWFVTSNCMFSVLFFSKHLFWKFLSSLKSRAKTRSDVPLISLSWYQPQNKSKIFLHSNLSKTFLRKLEFVMNYFQNEKDDQWKKCQMRLTYFIVKWTPMSSSLWRQLTTN